MSPKLSDSHLTLTSEFGEKFSPRISTDVSENPEFGVRISWGAPAAEADNGITVSKGSANVKVTNNKSFICNSLFLGLSLIDFAFSTYYPSTKSKLGEYLTCHGTNFQKLALFYASRT